MALNIEKEEKKIYKNKTIRLSEDLITRLDTIASQKNISFNKLVEKIIEYGINEVK